ncbi:MAG: hypothetical protein PVJ17_14985 [Lysobacterales bacterium]|jgi:hypothetical protein
MGLLDLPGPLFGAIDGALGHVLPPLVRLVLWGVLAGWLTMLVYRQLSNQEKISRLKVEQKAQQKRIAEFDGEIGELMPLVGQALGTGFRQLGLSLGPALLATVPVLFLVVWIAGAFGYELPEAGSAVRVTVEPPSASVRWQPADAAERDGDGWRVRWPEAGDTLAATSGGATLLDLPLAEPVPVIHKRQWWNVLIANPIGYLPPASAPAAIHLELPARSYLGFGPGWVRNWAFSFFLSFLVASVAFKLLLKID